MTKLKHKLPAFSVIDHLSLDDILLTELVKIFKELQDEFVSVLETNKKLCSVNHEFTKSIYDNFFQISLTDSDADIAKVDLDACESTYKEIHKYDKSTSIRNKKILSETAGSLLNEKEYGKLTEHYNRYKDVFDRVLLKFKGKPTRVRLVKLQAGSSLTPHIDYDPSYAVRIIIPIISNDECVNLFWVKNEIVSTSFIPGKAYFLNIGYKHSVVNLSKEDRYTFLVSVDGIEDINHLL